MDRVEIAKHPIGLSRPAVVQILVTYALMFGIFLASRYCLGGPKPLISLLILFLLYWIVVGANIMGFKRCALSKGYTSWLAFWLFASSFAGLIVLLLLPDRNA